MLLLLLIVFFLLPFLLDMCVEAPLQPEVIITVSTVWLLFVTYDSMLVFRYIIYLISLLLFLAIHAVFYLAS